MKTAKILDNYILNWNTHVSQIDQFRLSDTEKGMFCAAMEEYSSLQNRSLVEEKAELLKVINSVYDELEYDMDISTPTAILVRDTRNKYIDFNPELLTK